MNSKPNLKDGLDRIAEALAEFEQHARKLPNQHIADIAKGARGRVLDLQGHPDIGLVEREMIGEDDDGQQPFKFTPEPAPEFLADGSPNPEYKAEPFKFGDNKQGE